MMSLPVWLAGPMSPGQRPPCTETLLWTETPLNRDPGQRPPYGQEWAVHVILECILLDIVSVPVNAITQMMDLIVQQILGPKLI